MPVKALVAHPENLRTENTTFDRLNSVTLLLGVLLHRASRCVYIFRQIAFEKSALIELALVTNMPLVL